MKLERVKKNLGINRNDERVEYNAITPLMWCLKNTMICEERIKIEKTNEDQRMQWVPYIEISEEEDMTYNTVSTVFWKFWGTPS